jgi:hypothetical protein
MMWECFGNHLQISKGENPTQSNFKRGTDTLGKFRPYVENGDPQTTSTSPRCDPVVIHQDSFFGPGEVGTQEAMDGDTGDLISSINLFITKDI